MKILQFIASDGWKVFGLERRKRALFSEKNRHKFLRVGPISNESGSSGNKTKNKAETVHAKAYEQYQ